MLRRLILAAAALVAAPRTTHAQDGGALVAALDAATPASTEADPWELGAPATSSQKPAAMALRACSPSRVCVHGPAGAEAAALAALRHADAALAAARTLELPRPDVDVDSGAFDVFLVETGAGALAGGRTSLAVRHGLSSFDRASGFAVVPFVRPGCALEAAVSHAVFEAVVLRVAPATSEGLRMAVAAHLANLSGACRPLDDAAAFQRFPSRALFRIGDGPFERGAARGGAALLDWLDAKTSTVPGGLLVSTLAIAPSKTPPLAERFPTHPDLFDVFDKNLKGRVSVGEGMPDFLQRFTLSRVGAAPFPYSDFTVEWPARPRRFASPTAVEPSGAAFVRVQRHGAPKGSRLRVEVEWEEHARLRWAALRLGPGDRVLSNVLIPSTPRATTAQLTVAELDDAEAVLLAVVNIGDHARPFDPDDTSYEPHSYLLTIASE